MSLDVFLYLKKSILKKGTGVFIRENGMTVELTVEEVKKKFPNTIIKENEHISDCVFSANITHNLNKMASAADIYEACWRPENLKATKAKDILPLLEKGLKDMKAKPEHYKQFNPSNGWGTYDAFILWVEKYIDACREYPEAIIEVDR